MSPHLTRALFVICSIAAGLTHLSAGEITPPAKHDHEARLLKHLLEMDNEALANLRQTIERIERMTPEEKDLLRKRIGRMHRMDPAELEAMRKKYDAIPEATRREMRKRWKKMTPEERDEWKRKLHKTPCEECADTVDDAPSNEAE